jgi:hypothetical protein
MPQQNSSMMEEATAASYDLCSDATRPQELAHRFKAESGDFAYSGNPQEGLERQVLRRACALEEKTHAVND